MIGADQMGMAAVNYLCIKVFVYFTSYPVVVLHSNGYGLCKTICIFMRWVVLILVSCWANYNLNVSNNWLSDFLTSPGRVCKGGMKVSGCIIFCVIRLLIEVCSIWSMDSSIWPMHCPLLNNWLQVHVKLICFWCFKFHHSHGCLDQVPCWCVDYYWNITWGPLNCDIWWWLVWYHCVFVVF